MSATMITMTAITVILCVLAIVTSRKIEVVPGKLQNAMELVVEKLYDFFGDIIGRKLCRKYFALIATLFIAILLYNYSGLLPLSGELPFLKAPTSSINVPMAMAVVVFFATQFVGIRENRGLRYYKKLFKPVAYIFPLMIIEEFIHPLSLTLRLYGNIYGEEAVAKAMGGLVPILVPVVMQALSVLMGAIQALVFALLSSVYIQEAAEALEEE